jgi:hypothetical protein
LFAQGFCSAEIKCSQASLVLYPYLIFCTTVDWCVQSSIVVGYPLAELCGQVVTVFQVLALVFSQSVAVLPQAVLLLFVVLTLQAGFVPTNHLLFHWAVVVLVLVLCHLA